MLLKDAQAKVDTVLRHGGWLTFGAEVKYNPRCKLTYVITCNDWLGNECFFVMNASQLSNHERLAGELKTAWHRLCRRN